MGARKLLPLLPGWARNKIKKMKNSIQNKRYKNPAFSAYYRFNLVKTDKEPSLKLSEQVGTNKIFDAIFSSDSRYVLAHDLTDHSQTAIGFQIGSRRENDEVISFEINQCYGYGYGMKEVDVMNKEFDMDYSCHLIFTHPGSLDIHVLVVENAAKDAIELELSFRSGRLGSDINKFLGEGNVLIQAIDEFQRHACS